MCKSKLVLYKYFGIKRKHPGGRGKKDDYMSCCLPMKLENSIVINEGKIHKVVCKVCGTTHMDSNCYIDPNDVKGWWAFSKNADFSANLVKL